MNEHEFYKGEFPEHFFIGGDGGLELFALETAPSQPWPVVRIDPVAGAESAVVVADSMIAFINAIGVDTGED